MDTVETHNKQLPKIIFIFIDGIGFGSNDKSINPFARFQSNFFSPLAGVLKHSFPGDIIETDAHMGVKGLPQSATGQTALFTGINAPKILNRHITGFPTSSLKPYFKEYSILKLFKQHNLKAVLLNSYSKRYLNYVKTKQGQRFLSASSLTQLASEQPFFTLDRYLQNESMYMDITNWFLRSQKILDIDLISPVSSGCKLVAIANNYDLVLYEYFFTDKIGHKQSWGGAKRILFHIDQFIEGVCMAINPKKHLLIISSDHGNLEDLSTKTHTNNKVPTFIYGKNSEVLKKNIKFLYDIPREILRLYKISSDFNIVLP